MADLRELSRRLGRLERLLETPPERRRNDAKDAAEELAKLDATLARLAARPRRKAGPRQRRVTNE